MPWRYISRRELAMAELKKLFEGKPEMNKEREEKIIAEVFVAYAIDQKWIKEAIEAMVISGRAKRIR